MNNKLFLLIVGCGVLATAALATVAAAATSDTVQNRYPGSVRADGEGAPWSLKEGRLNHPAEYWSADGLGVVKGWYATLLHIDPASDTNGLTSGDCAWLTKAKRTFIVERTTSVLVCSARPGTRIVVNENVYLWP